MDFEKTAQSFEKHFSEKCEKICFCGMPLMLLKGESLCLSTALSVGGCAAVSCRRDGRFNARFDDNTKHIMSNIEDLEYRKNEPMLEFLTRLQKLGAQLFGADILFEYNTKLYNEYEPLLLSSMYLFCGKMPTPMEAKSCLSHPVKDFSSMVGIRDTILLYGAEKHSYIKFSDNAVKIVLCNIKDKNYIKQADDDAIKLAAKLLATCDYIQFGEIITREHGKNTKIGKNSKAAFELALRLNDALGCGFLEEGGIFAIVENKKVNAFVQNLKKEYETFYGAAPDFYITRAENSGIYGIVNKKGI